MTTRRGFMGAILAACAAPTIVRASSLMPIKATEIWMPANDLLAGQRMARECLQILERQLAFTAEISDEWMRGSQWSQQEQSRIVVRKPTIYVGRTR